MDEQETQENVRVCACCGRPTILFIWSSTRGFPMYKFQDIDIERLKEGVPICYHCRGNEK